MTSSSALKDLSRALRPYFSDERPTLPLPEELNVVIDSYLNSYTAADDHGSQKLQDELLVIYHSLDSIEQNDAFVKLLRQLRPAITGESRLAEWWSLVIRPVVDGIGHKRDTIEDAKEFLLSILIFEDEEDSDGQRAALSLLFTQRLLDAYLLRAKTTNGAGAGVSHEDEFIAHQLQNILVAYGRKRPKDFFLAVDGVFVQREHRVESLELLSSYVQLQPPYLHLVQQTPLLSNLLRCLRKDGASAVVDVALTVLIMFMPHVTKWLTANLPILFCIYSRLLCWNAKQASSTPTTPYGLNDDRDIGHSSQLGGTDSSEQEAWQVLKESTEHGEAAGPRTDYFFTFLYGLYPLNLVAFIKKPKKYLRASDLESVDELDLNQDMIRSRSDIHRRAHLLHPNFYLMDQEAELSDNRWVKSDAADIVMECLNLCNTVSVSLKDPGPPPQTKLPPIPPKSHPRKASIGPDSQSLTDDEATLHDASVPPSDARQADSTVSLRRTSRETSTQSLSRSSTGTSPAPKARERPPPSPTHPQNLQTSSLTSPLEILQQSLRKSEPSSPSARTHNLSHALSVAQFPTPPSTRTPAVSNRVASLQRDNMILRSDLNFERYLKQQHLSHIGQLQRKQIREASAEADAQNLINTNKSLQDSLAKAQEQYSRLKKETTMSRTQSKKFEDVLATKVKTYKEEERQWQSDQERLKRDVQRLQDDLDVLRKLLAESEQREFRLKSSVKVRDRESEALRETRLEVENLKDQLAEFERQKLRYSKLEEDNEDLQAQVQTLRIQIKSKDIERDRQRRNYGIQLRELEAQLESYRDNPHMHSENGQISASVQQMLDNTLSASQARFDRLKQTHSSLLHRYAELEMRCATMEADRDFVSGPLSSGHSQNKSSLDFDLPIASSMATNGRTPISPPSSTGGDYRRAPHAFSEPLLAELDLGFRGPTSTLSSQDSINTALPLQGLDQLRSYSRLDNLPRTDSLPGRGGATTATGERRGDRELMMQQAQMSGANGNGGHERGPSDFTSFNATSPLSMARSTHSTTSSQKSGEKAKVSVESKVRVYGRGGAQNINRKIKDKSDKADKTDKPAKTGAFRGLRGL